MSKIFVYILILGFVLMVSTAGIALDRFVQEYLLLCLRLGRRQFFIVVKACLRSEYCKRTLHGCAVRVSDVTLLTSLNVGLLLQLRGWTLTITPLKMC